VARHDGLVVILNPRTAKRLTLCYINQAF
jgi:hypothetical protein